MESMVTLASAGCKPGVGRGMPIASSCYNKLAGLRQFRNTACQTQIPTLRV